MIACGHCQERHETVAEVRTCAGLAPDPFLGNPPRKEPTEKQLNYAQTLLHERVPSGHTADLEIEQGISAAEEYVNSLSFHEMRSWIGTAKSWPMRKQRASSGSKIQVEDGMYLFEGDVVKVQYSAGNHLYAKVLDPTTNSFHYKSGLVSRLRPEHKMSLEQAKEYGALYGVCCVCGRSLTDPNSIEAGIGPICAKGF